MDRFKLFVTTKLFTGQCLFKNWKNRKALHKLVDKSQSKLQNKLDVFKLLKNITILKTLVYKTHQVDKNVQHFLLHSKKNQLCLDSSDDADANRSMHKFNINSDSENSDLLENIIKYNKTKTMTNGKVAEIDHVEIALVE